MLADRPVTRRRAIEAMCGVCVAGVATLATAYTMSWRACQWPYWRPVMLVVLVLLNQVSEAVLRRLRTAK
jgi:hypothetical protein